MTLFWFRRDLRLADNTALHFALTENPQVLPIFIFDTNILEKLPKNDARVAFIHQQIESINLELQKIGKSLAVFYGNPIDVFKKLTAENSIKNIYANRDYEPQARKRDKEVYDFLGSKNILFKSYKDQVIFEKNEVVKADGTPYLVFTPFSKKWKENFNEKCLSEHKTEPYFQNFAQHSYPFLSLNDIGFTTAEMAVKPFVLNDLFVEKYTQRRNFPEFEGSNLSVHLRFGTLSIREIIAKIIQQKDETFLNELIWREFFMYFLWHFPNSVTNDFRTTFENIQWENNTIYFEKWCNGQTGYPMVDAGMRELNQTGYMHNRVRMVVASFLCKHLLTDWRLGEAYFAEKLLDYEQSSNIGNWQWSAGCGVDAAPYFRVFNPSEQIKKFDPDYKYIKKWVPEVFTNIYPKPIVEHKEAREKFLNLFKKTKEGIQNI